MQTSMKYYSIFSYIKRCNTNLSLLQENHLTTQEATQLQRCWRGQIYAATYSAFARGALVWVRLGIPFEPIDKGIDVEGRYVLLQG